MSNPSTPQPPIYYHAAKSTSPWIIILVILLGCSLPTIGILVALLLPAVQSAREAARRMSCASNVRQIGMGLLSYEYTYKSLPPAFTVDEQGNKLHSWRALLLPFIEEQALYQSIDFSKPWDDPANASARETMVGVYACPSMPGLKNRTLYQAIVDSNTAFPGSIPRPYSEITDGLSNTILLLESSADAAVHWMDPSDASIEDFMNIGSSDSRTIHFGGCHVCFCDGAIRFISNETLPDVKKAMVTVDGDELVNIPQ